MSPSDNDPIERKLLIQSVVFVTLMAVALVLFFVFWNDPVPLLDLQPLTPPATP